MLSTAPASVTPSSTAVLVRSSFVPIGSAVSHMHPHRSSAERSQLSANSSPSHSAALSSASSISLTSAGLAVADSPPLLSARHPPASTPHPLHPPQLPSSSASTAHRSPALAPAVGEVSPSDAYGSSLYKTELCRSWSESLQCRYGSKCRFAHGLSELRAVARHRKYKVS